MKKCLLLSCCLLVGFLAKAQQYFGATQEEFGQNRVQSKRFDWKTIQSQNFDVNYYRGGEDIARQAIVLAETEFDRITSLLGYTPFTRMNIYIYTSKKDIQQSNMGLAAGKGNDNLLINLARSRIELPYPGSSEALKKRLVEQISRLFVYDMLYGGSLREVLQSSLLMSVPDWYMNGIARYIAADANATEDTLRQAVVQVANKKLSSLKGDEAALVGHSIWHFVAQRYGEQQISNILNLTRIIRMEESSIASTLGISFTKFLKEWRNYYTLSSEPAAAVQQPKLPQAPLVSKPASPPSPYTLPEMQPGEVDTENYTFDPTVVARWERIQRQDSLTNLKQTNVPLRVSPYVRRRGGIEYSTPKPFRNILATTTTRLEPVVDPLRRLGARGTLLMSDLLEQHKLKFTGFLTTSLRNHDISAEYRNYRNRLDWGLQYDRRSIYFETIEPRHYFLFRPYGVNLGSISQSQLFTIEGYRRLVGQRIQAEVAYPFSRTMRLAVQPFFLSTAENFLSEIRRNQQTKNYGGVKAELVFDNTREISATLLSGTRAKARLENFQGIGHQEGFNRILVDARHYQNLIRGVQLAGRVSFGSSAGASPKYSFLGGTENWINRSFFPVEGQAATLPKNMEQLYFYNFPGNLRGFEFGRLFGTHHILANLELRVSLIQFLYKGNIEAKILQNLQLIGFSDVGTAWIGNRGPFKKQNSLNTDVIGGSNSPFYAVVTNYRNPFLMGYGIGARTMIFGYIIRADYAYGRDNQMISSPRFYLSVGQDF